jgi:predicted DNA-binding WGR domain protein
MVVDEEHYFLALVRYIHLNPLRAGKVKSLAELGRYRWTGHAVLLGNRVAEWQEVDEVLSRFGRRAGPARRQLVAFMGENDAENGTERFLQSKAGRRTYDDARAAEKEPKEKPASDSRILGEGRFVESVLEQTGSESAGTAGIQDKELRRESFERLLTSVCRELGTTRAELVGGGKRRVVSRTRQVLSHMSLKYLGMTAAEVGRAVGISGQGIIKAAGQKEEVIRELKIDIERLTKKL